MPYTYELPVRYADTDAQGHTFFANYLTFCDEALTYFLEDLGCPYTSLEEDDGVMFVYASAGCDYRGRTLFSQRLRVEVEVERIGRTSLTTRYRVRRPDDTIAVEARLVSVCLDAAARTPSPLPDRLRAALVSRQTSDA
jgi:acyl-CoA thioester hydrolase